MSRIDLIPERQSNGTIILRAVVRRRGEALRRLIRRLRVAAATA
jgi:hypothetical protein